MNAADLFLLSRRLMQIAEAALPQSGRPATSLRFVAIDIGYHPGSSISEITERTGFPQSLVSLSVAKLRELGFVETEPDPNDRRRTLVRATVRLAERSQQGPGRVSIDELIAGELADGDSPELTEVLDALELLARVLLPEVATVTGAGDQG